MRRADVLLHVGAGTFKPVEVDDPAEHVMHEERYWLSDDCADALNATRARDAGIWAVGTTSVRTLESAVDPDGRVQRERPATRESSSARRTSFARWIT